MTETAKKPFKLGVVEGFFGTAWTWDARSQYADFFQRYAFNTYLYAPKSDRLLRSQWQQDFNRDHLDRLKSLCALYQKKHILFGIGITPFELYRDFSTHKRQQLTSKLEQINAIKPDILCILFDDMRGNDPKLAQEQARITDFILDHSQASQHIFCPTYYSFDEKLAIHFGKKPDNYLKDLGKLIDPALDIFWTGPMIFSVDYPAEHLEQVAGFFRRKPLIWDNYPVNDAARLTDFLHLAAFPDRASTMRELCAGHLANPMNQAFLSQIPLFTLAQNYLGLSKKSTLEIACKNLCSAELAKQILQDSASFQSEGLKNLDAEKKQALHNTYSRFADEAIAKEILDWLVGRYTFDPNCLT
jgi:hyaluronoglucosaminidase